MTTLLELVRQSEAYRRRSEELLGRAGDVQQGNLGGLRLYALLDLVAAALVLRDNVLARGYLREFITQGLFVEKDQLSLRAELQDAQAGYREFGEPYLHLAANVLNLELALGCKKRLGQRPPLLEVADVDADGYLGHETYLVELALGRRRQVEAIRAEYWAQWLEDELVDEADRGWQIAIALGQGRQEEFQSLLAGYIRDKRQGCLDHGPYGHHFAPLVLGLDGMAFSTTAQQCKMPFPPALLNNFGLAELTAQGSSKFCG